MFRVNKYREDIGKRVWPGEATSIMDFLSIRIIEQSAIAVAEHMRRGLPARQPSPKKSPSFRIPIVASFSLVATTVSLTRSSWLPDYRHFASISAILGLWIQTEPLPRLTESLDL
jgi:hypothetical protein